MPTPDQSPAAVPIGERPAFPVGGFPGMTYRQWLIGQVLPEAMRYVKGTPNSGNPGESSTFFNAAVEIAVLAADHVLIHLEAEKEIQKDDEARKETPDGPPA